MEKTAVRPRRLRRRRRRRLLPLVILLVVLAVAVPVVLSLLPHQPPVREEPDPHAGQVYVNDGANMVWLTPHDNLPVNPFTAADFTRTEDGALRYIGMTGTVRLGVDVSDYQSNVDWQRLAAQGVEFAILRIGYTGYTKGAFRADSAFARHLQNARAAGLDVYVDEPTKNKALYSHPMVSCTPHIGAATVEAQKRIGAEIVDIIKAM